MTCRLILITLLTGQILAATVGSKKFTESVILAEITTQLLTTQGFSSEHRDQLGGTRVLWNALIQNEIQIYPDYSGTIIHEILQLDRDLRFEVLRNQLESRGIGVLDPLGFNNTYAIGVLPETASRYGLNTISDLRNVPELVVGFTNEFMDRQDGWPGLRTTYGLPQRTVNGMDHDLAYRGLASGSIHIMDLYSTDAEIEYYGIRIMEDDLNYFPRYEALLLYRLDWAEQYPEALIALKRLSGSISEGQMVSLNSAVKIHGQTEKLAAAGFLAKNLGLVSELGETTLLTEFLQRSREHLAMVMISLSGAILLAIPLGVLATRFSGFGRLILGAVGVIQTIPSLALLVFMIPLLGIGAPPAILALFLYSLLPIVRNTHAGLHGIQPEIREAAMALGLTRGARLRLIELPLALPSILAGIKTAAVINVGTATLGALIGAGGYGQPILTGIRLDDMGLILQGAVPAAGLALLVQWLFDGIERIVTSPGLRLGTNEGTRPV